MDNEPDRMEEIYFCVCCFASEDGGSWGGGPIRGVGHCTNCGAGGSSFQLPRYAINEIRRNASWVGSRYYPSDDDHERHAELRELRSTVKHFPGRTVEYKEPDPQDRYKGYWLITQRMTPTKTRSLMLDADRASTPEKALEVTKCDLPYVPEERLSDKKTDGLGMFEITQTKIN